MKNIYSLICIFLVVGCATTNNGDELGYQGHQKRKSGQSEALNTLESLRKDLDVTFRTERQWTIASKNTETEKAIWSFPPESHEANPSVVKRAVEQSNGKISIVTTVSCSAAKSVCDRLVQEFIKLNDKVKNEINAQ